MGIWKTPMGGIAFGTMCHVAMADPNKEVDLTDVTCLAQFYGGLRESRNAWCTDAWCTGHGNFPHGKVKSDFYIVWLDSNLIDAIKIRASAAEWKLLWGPSGMQPPTSSVFKMNKGTSSGTVQAAADTAMVAWPSPRHTAMAAWAPPPPPQKGYRGGGKGKGGGGKGAGKGAKGAKGEKGKGGKGAKGRGRGYDSFGRQF
jgi:hypothetical protein